MRGPCAVHMCNNPGHHLLPLNGKLRTQWVKAMKLDHKQLRKYLYICSDHFQPGDFIITPALFGGDTRTKRLKKGTVPSIFPWTDRKNNVEEVPVKRVNVPLEDNVKFDPTLTSKTYSRTEPAIAFVEEIPYFLLESSGQEPVEDPLKLDFKDKIKYEIEEL